MPHVAAHGSAVVVSHGSSVGIEHSDFTIPAASLTAVIGPNGSGKSTLLDAVAGLAPTQAGVLHVLGDAPGKHPARVSYVLQSTTVNEAIPVTVAEVVAMGRYARRGLLRRFGDTDRQAVSAAMRRVGVESLAGRHLSELSGGERQRVFVAQGLAQQADLVLLDEPTTALDLVSREAIDEAIREELARGATVVVTTHDVAEAQRADHVLLMSGRVHSQGLPAETLTPDRLADAYGIGIVHLEDGSVVLDDAAHTTASERHVHFERGIS